MSEGRDVSRETSRPFLHAMPFSSQAQAGWAFANKKPFAKRWARQTGPYKRLPYKKKSFTLDQLEAFVCSPHYDPDTADAIAAGIPEIPSLKGEQIAPGITRIRGNLCNVHGRYGRCPGAPAAVAPTPRKGRKPRTPKKTDAERAQASADKKRARDMARATEHATNRGKVLSGLGIDAAGAEALDALQSGDQPDAASIARGGFVAAGLVEQARDGSYRITASGRAAMAAAAAGDAGRAGGIISSARDRVTARGERTAAATARRAQALANREQAKRARLAKQQAAKKPGKSASGGGGKTPAPAPRKAPAATNPQSHASAPAVQRFTPKPPTNAQTTAANRTAVRNTMMNTDQGLAPGGFDNLMALARGTETSTANGLIAMGLAERGGDGTLRLTTAGRQTITATNRGDAKAAIDAISSARDRLAARMERARAAAARRAAAAARRAAAAARRAAAAGTTTKDAPCFRVFKDASGALRWVAQSSTAYQDRDKEIVSIKALADDCVFADKHQSYGPLRWWHTPGLDLGDCDFNAMHGKILIESGTFRSPAIAQKVTAAADSLEISLGFIHLPTDPDASGVYHHIRRFERSLVPRGKASNRFTAFRVKETRMFDPTKMAALKTLGFSDADITALQTQAEATEKAADAAGVAYKADDPPAPDLVINGIVYKAFGAPMSGGGDAPAEGTPEEEAAETPAEEDTEMAAGEGDAGGLTLSPEDISAIGQAVSDALTQALGPLVSTMDLTNKIGGHMADLKTMMGGYQTKKDTTDAERDALVASLTVALKDTQTKLDDLLGLQPAVHERASAAPQTMLNPFNPADNALLQAVKEQVAPAGYSNDFEDLKRQLFGNG